MIQYILQQGKIKKLFSVYLKNLNNHIKKSEKLKYAYWKKQGSKRSFVQHSRALTRVTRLHALKFFLLNIDGTCHIVIGPRLATCRDVIGPKC